MLVSAINFSNHFESKNNQNFKNFVARNNTAYNCQKYCNNIPSIAFKANFLNNVTKLERFKGCILGGAIGDALGAPIEFKSISEIKKLFGKNGIKDLQIGYSTGLAEITDDTQMTIYTIDGLIRSLPENFNPNKKIDINILYDSYKQWYRTQTETIKYEKNTSWINNFEDLYVQKDPGNACLSSLAGNIAGTVNNPINNSKGSGCIMRVAPVGLLYNENPKLAFEIGKESAALTHGNPTGYLSAGSLASIIAYITRGETLNTAISETITYLKKNYIKTNATIDLINKMKHAQNLAKSNISEEKAIEKIGKGWVADEALSMALYCSLRKNLNFVEAVRIAVNHSGDSDTVGAITGNIMGCIKGSSEIPDKWLSVLQFRQMLSTLANDLYNAPEQIGQMVKKYPFYGNRIPKWYKLKSSDKSMSTAKKFDKIKFPDAELELMKKMSIEERIKYKQLLIKNKKFEF